MRNIINVSGYCVQRQPSFGFCCVCACVQLVAMAAETCKPDIFGEATLSYFSQAFLFKYEVDIAALLSLLNSYRATESRKGAALFMMFDSPDDAINLNPVKFEENNQFLFCDDFPKKARDVFLLMSFDILQHMINGGFSLNISKKDLEENCKRGIMIITTVVVGDNYHVDWISYLSSSSRAFMPSTPGASWEVPTEAELASFRYQVLFEEECKRRNERKTSFIAHDIMEGFGLSDFGFNRDEIRSLHKKITMILEKHSVIRPADPNLTTDVIREFIHDIIECLDDCQVICPEKVKEVKRAHEEEAHKRTENVKTFVRDALADMKMKSRVKCMACSDCGHFNYSIPYKCQYCAKTSSLTSKSSAVTLNQEAIAVPSNADYNHEEVVRREVERANQKAADAKKNIRKACKTQTTFTSKADTTSVALTVQNPVAREKLVKDIAAPASKISRRTTRRVKMSRDEQKIFDLVIGKLLNKSDISLEDLGKVERLKKSSYRRCPQGDRRLAQALSAGEVLLGSS